MNIFEKLRNEHEIARELLELVDRTSGDSEGRRELFFRLKQELDDHAAAEEVSLYRPMLGTHAQDKATHSIKEHEDIRDLCEELADMDFSSPGWLRRFRELRETVEHHMDEEEAEVFQQAGRVLGDEREKDELARKHAAERESRSAHT